MTDLPPPPPPPLPPPPPPPPPAPPGGAWSWGSGDPIPPPPPFVTPRRSRRHAVLGGAIAALLVAAAIRLVTPSFDRGPDHPDEWDPRVADLAAFVEDERSLDFDHPVHVDFLTPAEYTEETTEDEEAVSDDERAELDRYAGQLRAFGLGSGEIDLFDAFNAVSDSGTLAFYDTVEERVKVRGTELTVGLRVTLAHELTHALQHQHFDIDALYDEDLDSSASTALRALIEGDALRVEEAYTSGELSAEEQAEYDEEYTEELEASEASTSDVPPFISASFSVPYLLGQPFVLMLANEGGNRAVNAAFESPPETEEHLFDPASFLAGEGAVELELELDEDIEVLDDGPFGSPTWYLMLAERIDPKVAFEAALGWAGDAYATFERDGRSCARAAFAGDSEADEDEMRAALSEWATSMPGGMAKAMEIDGHPGLESCDPGEDVDLELSGYSEDALFLPSLWGYLVADAATALDADGARCYASEVLAGLTYEQITDPEGAAFEGDEFQQALSEAFEVCV